MNVLSVFLSLDSWDNPVSLASDCLQIRAQSMFDQLWLAVSRWSWKGKLSTCRKLTILSFASVPGKLEFPYRTKPSFSENTVRLECFGWVQSEVPCRSMLGLQDLERKTIHSLTNKQDICKQSSVEARPTDRHPHSFAYISLILETHSWSRISRKMLMGAVGKQIPEGPGMSPESFLWWQEEFLVTCFTLQSPQTPLSSLHPDCSGHFSGQRFFF